MTGTHLLIPAAAAAAMLLASACAAAPPAAGKRPVLRVLFVGNSYTYSTDVPGMMARIAAADDSGPLIKTTFIGNGGYTLARHLKEAKSLKALRDGKYDVAVFQKQSQMPLMYPKVMQAAAVQLDALVKAAGAQTVLYATWCRKHQPEKQAISARKPATEKPR